MNQAKSTDYNAVVILEKDFSGDVLASWMYPSCSPEMQQILVRRSTLKEEVVVPFTFSRYESQWVYISSVVLEKTEGEEEKDPLKIQGYAVVLVTKSFHPEKAEALCRLMGNVYSQAYSTVAVLEVFLAAMIRSEVSINGVGSFKEAEYDPRASLIATNIKDLIRMFGMHSILLWFALFNRKRVVVTCSQLPILQKAIRAMPQFMWHRQNWDILQPYLTAEADELAALSSVGVYVAGFVDEAIKAKSEMYDLLVDMDERKISFPEHAAASFKMGQVHRELAGFMVSLAESDTSPPMVIKELSNKTKIIETKLKAALAAEKETPNE